LADSTRKLKTARLVDLFAPTLGQEKSESLVASSMRKLGVPAGEELRFDHAVQVLDQLAQTEGIVGVVARFIKARGELDDLDEVDEPTTLLPRPLTPSGGIFSLASSPDGVPGRLSAAELNGFLAPALGEAKGLEAIAAYAVQIGASSDHFTRGQALQMLELMAQAQGALGTVARFAKARFILKYPA
jgi:hypothetical protein